MKPTKRQDKPLTPGTSAKGYPSHSFIPQPGAVPVARRVQHDPPACARKFVTDVRILEERLQRECPPDHTLGYGSERFRAWINLRGAMARIIRSAEALDAIENPPRPPATTTALAKTKPGTRVGGGGKASARPPLLPSVTQVDTHRQCSTCNTVKPVSEFPPDKNRPGGRRAQCRSCIRVAGVRRDRDT